MVFVIKRNYTIIFLHRISVFYENVPHSKIIVTKFVGPMLRDLIVVFSQMVFQNDILKL